MLLDNLRPEAFYICLWWYCFDVTNFRPEAFWICILWCFFLSLELWFWLTFLQSLYNVEDCHPSAFAEITLWLPWLISSSPKKKKKIQLWAHTQKLIDFVDHYLYVCVISRPEISTISYGHMDLFFSSKDGDHIKYRTQLRAEFSFHISFLSISWLALWNI